MSCTDLMAQTPPQCEAERFDSLLRVLKAELLWGFAATPLL